MIAARTEGHVRREEVRGIYKKIRGTENREVLRHNSVGQRSGGRAFVVARLSNVVNGGDEAALLCCSSTHPGRSGGSPEPETS